MLPHKIQFNFNRMFVDDSAFFARFHNEYEVKYNRDTIFKEITYRIRSSTSQRVKYHLPIFYFEEHNIISAHPLCGTLFACHSS